MSETVERIRAAVTPGEHRPSRNVILLWRILTPISWLFIVITSTYYTFRRPHEGGNRHYDRHTIWGQNGRHHTPFALNSVIVSIYWIVLYLLQLPYLYNLYAPPALVTPAVILAPYFTLNNFLAFGFVHLWVRGYFWWALLIAVINWINLTFGYFRYPKSPVLMHVAVLAGPLAFAFVTLFWDGAAAFNAHKTPARIVANIFIWSWAVYGGFYLVAFKDWALGFCLSVLLCALGVYQFLIAIVALQWIFAFTLMAVLFLASVVVAFPDATGVQFGRGQIVEADRERAPLLADEHHHSEV